MFRYINYTFVGMTAQSILKAIEARDPALVNEVKEDLTPMSLDMAKIVPSYQIFLLRTNYTDDVQMGKLEFVACMARIYNPACLYVEYAIMKGFKKYISKCFGDCTERTVTYYITQARHYYRHVKRFRDNVDLLSKGL